MLPVLGQRYCSAGLSCQSWKWCSAGRLGPEAQSSSWQTWHCGFLSDFPPGVCHWKRSGAGLEGQPGGQHPQPQQCLILLSFLCFGAGLCSEHTPAPMHSALTAAWFSSGSIGLQQSWPPASALFRLLETVSIHSKGVCCRVA